MAAQELQFCTFMVDQYCLAVEVRRVQEVLRFQKLTRVPLASPLVRGLINLRGQIVVAIDLRRRLGLSERPPESPPMNVILRTEQGAVSLLVDKIGDVCDVQSSTFEPPPQTLRALGRELVRGVYKLPDRLLILLDADRAIASAVAPTNEPVSQRAERSPVSGARASGADAQERIQS